MRNLIAGILCALFLTGCSLFYDGKNKSPKPIQERIVNIPLQVPGIMLSQDDIGRLRTSENVKTYYIGRLIDPDNPDVLHPSGEVFEVIDKPRWIMTPRPVKLPSGVPIKLVEDRQSRSLITEFKQDMTMIKQTVKALTLSREELKKARGQLNHTVKTVNAVLKEIKTKDRKSEEINNKIDALTQKISELENKSLFNNTNQEKKEK